MTTDTSEGPARFVIVTLPRSGSYNLVSLLDSAPDIACHGELFKSNAVELNETRLGKLGMKSTDVEVRDAKPMAFLQRVRGLNARKVVGFKMFPEHASRLKVLREQVLRNPRWRKIFLRRDPLASYASLMRARETGIWTLRAAAPSAHPRERLDTRVTFTPETFDRHMDLVDWFDQACAEFAGVPDNPCMTVDFDAVADLSALPGILAFVGSTTPADALKSDYARQYGGSLEEGFTNWDALASHARARELARATA